MTKFNIVYIGTFLPTTELAVKRAVVTLQCTTVKDAAALLSQAGGFQNEIGPEFIGFGAIMQIAVMES